MDSIDLRSKWVVISSGKMRNKDKRNDQCIWTLYKTGDSEAIKTHFTEVRKKRGTGSYQFKPYRHKCVSTVWCKRRSTWGRVNQKQNSDQFTSRNGRQRGFLDELHNESRRLVLTESESSGWIQRSKALRAKPSHVRFTGFIDFKTVHSVSRCGDGGDFQIVSADTKSVPGPADLWPLCVVALNKHCKLIRMNAKTYSGIGLMTTVDVVFLRF